MLEWNPHSEALRRWKHHLTLVSRGGAFGSSGIRYGQQGGMLWLTPGVLTHTHPLDSSSRQAITRPSSLPSSTRAMSQNMYVFFKTSPALLMCYLKQNNGQMKQGDEMLTSDKFSPPQLTQKNLCCFWISLAHQEPLGLSFSAKFSEN